MAFDTCEFFFDGISSQEYGLTYYEIDNFSQDNGVINDGFSVVSDFVAHRHQPIHYGVKKSEHMEFDMVFGSLNYLLRLQVAEIAQWLTGRSTYAPLVFDGEDLSGLQYKAIFTQMEMIQYSGLAIAFRAHVVCDSPFAYTELMHVAHQCAGTTKFVFTNISNVPEMYAPDIRIELPKAQNFKMVNNTTGETVSFEFSKKNTSDMDIIIAGKTKVVTLSYGYSTVPLNPYEYMLLNGQRHIVFPRFAPGPNRITVTGNCVIHFTSEFPMQVGY